MIDKLLRTVFPGFVSRVFREGVKHQQKIQDDEKERARRSRNGYFYHENPTGELYIVIGPSDFDVTELVGYMNPDQPMSSPRYGRSILNGGKDVSIDFRIYVRYNEDLLLALSLLTHQQRYVMLTSRGLMSKPVDVDVPINVDYVISCVDRFRKEQMMDAA